MRIVVAMLILAAFATKSLVDGTPFPICYLKPCTSN